MGNQGCDHTLFLQEHFWWPGMVKQMRQTIRACTHCLQYEGGFPKALLLPIVATPPLDVLHVDFTSIETTLEPNQSHRVAKCLGFPRPLHKTHVDICDPWSNCETIAKFLYGGYISIFGAPARLLGDRGASFMSSIIEELCKILGVKQLLTTPYHPRLMGW